MLKVHQRCNLACDYCYVYTKADQSWRDRPVTMAPETWRAAARRMAEHVRAHRLADVRLVLHGGEPLLMGRQRLAALVADFRAAVGDGCRVDVRMQTNGALLDEPMLALLEAHRIRVGVSLDGAAADHDRHRRGPDGAGSHRAVDRALRLLTSPRHRSRVRRPAVHGRPDHRPGRLLRGAARVRAAVDRLPAAARELVGSAGTRRRRR